MWYVRSDDETLSVLLSPINVRELKEQIVNAVVARLTPLLMRSAVESPVTREQMAKLLNVSTVTLDRQVSSGEIPSLLMGARRLFVP